MKNFDELQLSKDLIKFPSVTPIDAGAISYLSKNLKTKRIQPLKIFMQG